MAEQAENTEERTEQATTQRREDFRKAGQVAQSREVGSVLVLMGILAGFYFLSRQFLIEIQDLFSHTFTDQLVTTARSGDIIPAMKLGLTKFISLVLPVFGITLFTGIGASVMQIGFLAAWDHISPDIERINPISGMKKIFNLRSLVEGGKSILKIIIVSSVAFLLIKEEASFAPQVVQLSVAQILSYTGFVIFKLFGGICVLMALLALLDYGFQRWDLERRMRMTKQEIKEEFKQREGDPLIKSRIRRIQRDLAQKRMMEQVPKADVIITNPTHIAVALRYDRETMIAPAMIAKGADFVAEKIKELARKHNVPIVENKPLARTLYKTLKLGEAIPKALYNAVAEVLAYVYKLKGKLQQVSKEIADNGRTL